MATSPIYSWPEPDNTDLVKNGALAIRTLGNAIDTTMATMTPKSLVDAKGDLIAASANDTPARLAVGNNGETLVADSSTATGLRWQGNFAAGKNKIINGDFGIWQRGTSFSNPSNGAYTADRFDILYDGTGATRTISQQTFTPGSAPVSGYEGSTFFRFALSAAGTGNTTNVIEHRIEDVRTFAGQTVTLSFWAKYGSTTNLGVYLLQNFGSGGSTQVNTTVSASTSIGTSWTRYTLTATLPSISGKTIGTSSYLNVYLALGGGSAFTFDIWGVQLEAGSVATAFQTATGTIQGELAACQRYYFRITAGADNYVPLTHIGGATSTTATTNTLQLPVTLRAAATSIEYANLSVYGGGTLGFGFLSVSSLSLIRSSTSMLELTATVSGATTGAFYRIQPNGTAGYIGVVAEL